MINGNCGCADNAFRNNGVCTLCTANSKPNADKSRCDCIPGFYL